MDAADKPPLLAIVGPTASGKSDLALQLALRHQGEIISADSVQIYRYFDIGSGKPSAAELASVPHHLIGAIEPTEEMDASLFAERALKAIEDVRSRGHLPIICGGTFLWVRALIYGLAPAPPKDDELRQRHRQLVEAEGRAALHLKLKAVDPASFERLEPNDFVRVSRALEVYELTGTPLSEFQAQHGFREPRFRVHFLGVQHTPEALTERIRQRAAKMLERGWLTEVRQLAERGFRETRPMASVGYRQVLEFIDAGRAEDEALLDEVTRVTRIFARRQRTWLRDEPIEWLTPERVPAYQLPEHSAPQ